MADNTTPREVQDLDQSIGQFKQALMTDNLPKGPLWKAWHFLQVYSTWGLRLPHTEASLKLKLNVSDTGSYSFFPNMLQGYDEIYKASSNFQEKVFPEVVRLGNSLRSFAEEAKTGDDGVFNAIVDLVNAGDDESIKAVLELIKDLQEKATNYVDEADKISILLAGYSADLVTAEATVKSTQEKVDSDDKVSTARINELKGGKDIIGSIENYKTLADSLKTEYDHDVVVAATSPTYAWVYPFGTIAAAVVAGIYGSRAVKALKDYNEMKSNIDAATSELSVAINTHTVQSLANQGLTKAKDLTQSAIEQTNVVKNAWAALSRNLETVQSKVEGMTNKEEDKKLKAKSLVLLYARQSGKSWASLWPAVKALTDDPYITVENNDKDVNDIIKEIEAYLANPVTQN